MKVWISRRAAEAQREKLCASAAPREFKLIGAQPSLRDLDDMCGASPTDKSVGYYQSSLRDISCSGPVTICDWLLFLKDISLVLFHCLNIRL